MSAETLREAASLMRVRAEAATAQAGPSWRTLRGLEGRAWLQPAHIGMHGYLPTVQYIASWHPVVALAVADVLDDEAYMAENAGRVLSSAALDLARAYLGGAA